MEATLFILYLCVFSEAHGGKAHSFKENLNSFLQLFGGEPTQAV